MRLCLLAVVLSVFALACTADNSWDLLLLVRVWPGYSSHKFPSAVNDFTIHGLWPERSDGTWPQFCTNAPYDPSAVQDLLPTMNVYWADGFDPSNNTSLWVHEWVKHGTCATNLYTLKDQHSFFQGALNLHEKYNLTDALSAGSVTPGASYPVDQYSSAIEKAFGQKPIFNCAKLNGQPVLQQVYICVDKTLKVMACSSQIMSKVAAEAPCKDSVLLPPIQH